MFSEKILKELTIVYIHSTQYIYNFAMKLIDFYHYFVSKYWYTQSLYSEKNKSRINLKTRNKMFSTERNIISLTMTVFLANFSNSIIFLFTVHNQCQKISFAKKRENTQFYFCSQPGTMHLGLPYVVGNKVDRKGQVNLVVKRLIVIYKLRTYNSRKNMQQLFSRCLLILEYQLPHPILCTTLATDKK